MSDDEELETSPANVPPGGLRRTLIVLGILGGLGAGVWAVYNIRGQAAVHESISQATRAIDDHRYDEAERILKRAESEGCDPETLEALRREVRSGQIQMRAIDEARAALAAHRFDDARVTLQGVTSDAPTYVEAQKLLAQIEPARVHWLYEQAQEALKAGQLDRARQLLPEVAQLEPELGKTLGLAIAAQTPTTTLGLSLDLDRNGPEPAVRKAFAPAFAKFASGDLPGASKAFSEAGQSHPDGTLRAAARSLALASQSCGQALAAASTNGVADLSTAIRTCGDVEPAGRTVSGLRARLAQTYDAQGNAALAKDQALDAARAFRSAQLATPEDPGAAQGIAALRAKAPALATAARASKDPQAARNIWQALANVLPEADPLRAEALQASQGP
ncbi:MAG: hypothetical protein JST54_27635 [Deltaproteobacteria bacterium]|nr:hypothetical protein [Deltaproteobacteria bacterium]